MKLKNTMTKTEKYVFFSFSFALLFFIIFLCIYHITDMQFFDPKGQPCGMKFFLHLYCPGCGGTRSLDAFLHGDILNSIKYHPFFTYMALYFLSYYIPSFLKFIGVLKKNINYMIYVYILWGLLALVIIVFVGRNLLLVFGGVDFIGESLRFWQ